LQANLIVSLAAVTALLKLIGTAFEQNLCSFEKPPQTIFTGAASRESVLASTITVNRPIRELAPLVDPRRWDVCSTLFRKTYTVRAVGCGRYERYDNGKPFGTPWRGLLYERVEAIPVTARNVLRIIFQANLAGPCPKLVVYNDLYESLSSEVAG